MKEKEEGVMGLYRETRIREFFGEASNTNHLAWSLLVLTLGLIIWLLITLSNAENQRNALASKACQDRVFAAELDTKCLVFVQTRPHWWQHVWYAMTHLRPE
ncbi:MAG TPA: hypothetical protein DCW29_12345 [Janthinobacterium sp.]|nr:hypothetical protein [Janthinobacterium sp.]